jgi:hypothetical protein
MAIFTRNWGGLTEKNQAFFDEAYGLYVPCRGKANTVGGEILRAISRIVYKFYNDGDTVARYYSCALNLSWAADRFLAYRVPTYSFLNDITDDVEFELKLSKNFNNVVDYLKKNPQLFETPNEDDCIENAPLMEYPEWNDEVDEGCDDDDD